MTELKYIFFMISSYEYYLKGCYVILKSIQFKIYEVRLCWVYEGSYYILLMMMIIAPNSRARMGEKESGEVKQRGEVKEEYGGIWGEREGNADGWERASNVEALGYIMPCLIFLQPPLVPTNGYSRMVIACRYHRGILRAPLKTPVHRCNMVQRCLLGSSLGTPSPPPIEVDDKYSILRLPYAAWKASLSYQ